MPNTKDSISPMSPTEASNPVKMHQWFRNITDWIASMSLPGASVYDTGWQNIALNSGFNQSGASPAWAREGKTLHLRGGIAPASGGFPIAGVRVGTLSYAPPSQHVGTCSGPGVTSGKVVLDPDGSITVFGPSDGSLTYARLDGIVWKLTV